jgi:hypothetical protein
MREQEQLRRLLLEAHNALPDSRYELRERIFKALHPNYEMSLFAESFTMERNSNGCGCWKGRTRQLRHHAGVYFEGGLI